MTSRFLVVCLALLAASFHPNLVPIATAQDQDDAGTLERVVVEAQRPEPTLRGIGGGGFENPYAPSFSPFDSSGGTADFEPNYGDLENVADAAKKRCDQRGNPVALPTGNKIESMVDFASAGEMPLSLERTYNRRWTYRGLFGMNVVSNVDYSLTETGASTPLWLQRPDGRRIRFVPSAANQWLEDKPEAIASVTKTANEYVHITEFGGTETYTLEGRPLTIKNRHGVGWTFSYAANFSSFTITHSSGRTMVLALDTLREVTSVTDPDGEVYTYTYNLNGVGTNLPRLQQVNQPNGTVITYHYEQPGWPDALTGLSFNTVRYSTFAYDNLGRAISTQHTGALLSTPVERFSFNYTGVPNAPVSPPPDPPPPICRPGVGNCPQVPSPPPEQRAALAEIDAQYQAMLKILRQPMAMTEVIETNPLTRVTTHQINSTVGRIQQSDGAISANCAADQMKRVFDIEGYLDHSLDFNGNRTNFDYDSRGQLLSQTEAVGTPLARTTTWTWNEARNLPLTIELAGHSRTTYSYTAAERVSAITTRNLTAFGTANEDRTTTITYTLHPNQLIETQVVDGPIPTDSDALTYTYADTGDLLTIANSLGHTITFSDHNGRGQPGKRTGVNGEVVEWTYDDRGRVTQATTRRNNVAASTSWAYAANGLLQSMTQSDGVVESYSYDAARRVTSITRAEVDATFKQSFTRDAASNITRVQGYLVSNSVDNLIFDETRKYDEQNRLIERASGPQNIGSDAYVLNFAYDLNDNLTEIRPVIGAVTTLTYDSLDRLSTRTDAQAGITRYFYDKADRLIEFRDPRLVTTTFKIDGFGQVLEESSPDTGLTEHVYDAAGLLTQTTRADGGILNRTYDGLGRLITNAATIGAQAESHTTTWDVFAGCANGKGRICRVTDPHQMLTLSYTREGELQSQQNQIGTQTYNTSFVYDAQGRLTDLTYPNATQIRYEWGAGRARGVAQVASPNPIPILSNATRSYAMAPNGNVAMVDTQTFGNDRVRLELTDRSGRFYATSTSPKQGREAFFDANNRIKGINNFNTGDNQAFTHDGLNRLTGLTSVASGDQAFGYDPSSNRSLQVRGIQEDYQIDPASNRINQITRTVASQTQTLRTYAYRATGEVSSITGGASDLISESRFEYPLRNVTFSYDPFNRLKQVTGQNLNASYKIAATNLRVAKTVNGRTTHFIYSLSGQLLYEVDLTTNRTSAHVYFDGKPIALIRNGARSYVLTDHLGRPELLMDDTPAANTVWKATLGAFDKVAVTIDTIGGYHLGFPGQYFDEETGFAHNIHRDYDSSSGRYLQPDPIGLVGGGNRYLYADASPVMSIDQLGLTGCFVNFIGYPITVPGTNTQIPLNHAAVLSYDSDGRTRYYEYGRYQSNFGNVRRQAVPNLTMDKDGNPTSESWGNLLKALNRFGKGAKARASCNADSDADKINAFAERRMSDPKREPYSWNPISPNTCVTFANEAIEAGLQ